MCHNQKEKNRLRRVWREVRASVPNREEKNQQIRESFLTYSAVKQAKSVFLYLSFGTEVDTLSILKELLAQGKQVAVPLCHPETGTMDPVLITDPEALEPGSYGILVPTNRETLIPPREIAVAAVPALAFDRQGYRLGYGGGYYDRFLKEFSGLAIGLAFSDCITEILPRESFDRPVDRVITDMR